MNTKLLPLLAVLLLARATQALAAPAPDPTTVGVFTPRSGEYKFVASVDPLVTTLAKTELWAKVWYPTGRAFTQAPVAILLHGNHGTCGRLVGGFRVDDNVQYSTQGTCPRGYVVTPNHTGYDYVASRLASNGWVVVSINANRGITAHPESTSENDPGLIQRRGRMILRHLQVLGLWNQNGGQPASVGFNFKGKLDFRRVVLFGHSRGGDAIIAAYNLFKTSAAWRGRLPAVTRIVGLASLAPTDFQAAKPLVRDTRLAVLLPMCDGDVSSLSGIHFHDRSVFPTTTDTAGNYKSVFAVWGTNHNGYNTQWQTDDAYQATSHTCPGQGKLFPHPLGLSPPQQAIGRFFLMALARGSASNANYSRLFNPTYTLPSGLTPLTRFDRSYFAGSPGTARRILRFDGTCSSKFAVTQNVVGACLTPWEHDPTTRVGRVRWNATGQATNAARFTLNNDTAFNLTGSRTLDLRVGPDCFFGATACTNISPTENGLGSQNVVVLLQDAAGKFSQGVSLLNYVERRPAVGVSIPAFLNPNPRYHAILSSARIPTSAFATTGFNPGTVKYLWVVLGNATSRGGLYFGDVGATPVEATAALSASAQAIDGSVASGGGVRMASAQGVPPNADQPLYPASEEDGVVEVPAAAPGGPPRVIPADAGHKIVSVRRGTMSAASGLARRGSGADSRMQSVPTVEFLLSTPEPIVDTSASGLTVVIGGRSVQARLFETDQRDERPSVAKLVVSAEAIDQATDGASLSVVDPTKTWHFGPLDKSSIR